MVIKILAGVAIVCLLVSISLFVKGINAAKEYKALQEKKVRDAEEAAKKKAELDELFLKNRTESEAARAQKKE